MTIQNNNYQSCMKLYATKFLANKEKLLFSGVISLFFIYILFFLLLSFSLQNQARCETLEDLTHSSLMHQKRVDKANKLSDAKWMDPESTLHRLFAYQSQRNKLIEWLEFKSDSITVGSEDDISSTKMHYLGYTKKYTRSSLNDIIMTVLLPHPKYRDAADLGLIEAFAKHLPPKLQVNHSEEVQLPTVKAQLRELQNGGYSLLIPTSQHSIVVLETSKNELKNSLIEMARLLPIDYFNQQLDS